MAVDEGTPVTRDMLDDAHDADRSHAIEHGAAERRDLHRLRTERPVADDVASAFLAHI